MERLSSKMNAKEQADQFIQKQGLQAYQYQLDGENISSSQQRFARECLKEYIHVQMKNRSDKQKKKPVSIKSLPNFDQDQFMDIMDKKYEETGE